MRDDPHSTALPNDVFEAELAVLVARRDAARLDSRTLAANPTAGPSVHRELKGLAISGGGIRSSTFSLGVIQALAAEGAFPQFDYMSTVSGGGYTGSMLSSLLRDPGRHSGEDPAVFPLTKPEGVEEPPALKHLRNACKYLNPGGLLNTMRMPAIVLRGLLLNALLVLPWIMLAVIFTEILHEYGRSVIQQNAGGGTGAWVGAVASGPLAFVIAAAALLALYVMISFVRARTWAARNAYELAFAGVLVALAGLVLAIPLVKLLNYAIEHPLRGQGGLGELLGDRAWGAWSVSLTGCVSLYSLVKASKHLTHALARGALYVAGVLGPALLVGVFLLLVVAQVDCPFIHDRAAELPPAPALASAQPMAVDVELSEPLRQALVLKGVRFAGTSATGPVSVPAVFCPAQGATGSAWLLPWENVPPSGAQASPAVACGLKTERELGASSWYRVEPAGRDLAVVGAGLFFGAPPGGQTLMSDWAFMFLALALLLLNWIFLDVNRSSLLGFYRDRLSRLYLFRLGPDGAIEPNPTQKLSELNQPGSRAPYHILNTTLNLQGLTTMSARGRSSDFFFFSKEFYGGPQTGYARTADLERWSPSVDLATAMAISAAAAGPNMGSQTRRSLTFVMTLLNFRLGYWVPNPARVKESVLGRRLRPSTLHLWREAMGKLDAEGAMVNLSDGGHLENLAIFELLRRKCRVIVAIDGEGDPKLVFTGLITLLRIARIDLGLEIDIDLSSLRRNAAAASGAHMVVGTIHYGGVGDQAQIGHLIYVKSSLTGDEGPFVQKYTADNAAFPHESTADQFFDEVQFEAYRTLGYHVGQAIVRDPAVREGLGLAGKIISPRGQPAESRPLGSAPLAPLVGGVVTA